MTNVIAIETHGFAVTDSMTEKMRESIAHNNARLARKYMAAFWPQMTSGERIGVLSRIVETGHATDAEECQLLDLIDPAQAYRGEE